jgi:predicted nucleotidyltransferase
MRFGLEKNIIEGIQQILRKNPQVNRAVIFGSRARGDYRYNSDIDLAIYVKGDMPSRLWLDLDEAAGIYKLDIVEMNDDVDQKLRRHIEEEGIDL